MKILNKLIDKFFYISLLSIGLGQTLNLEDIGSGYWNVNYSSEEEISGFQFLVDGAIIVGNLGGAAEDAGFIVSASGTTLIGFSLSGANIPADNSGILLVLYLDGEPTGLSEIVISDQSGNDMDFSFIGRLGCMDDGYQIWSPNYGLQACNYDASAIIASECLYFDCEENCGGTKLLDCSGNCLYNNDLNWDLSCVDCNGIVNGLAYYDACNQCVGGNTNNLDCFNIDINANLFYSPSNNNIIEVFAEKFDMLNSIDIEFYYNSSLINITNFSIYETELASLDYDIEFSELIEDGIFKGKKMSLFFNPHLNSSEAFVPNGKVNIFNIVIEILDINANSNSKIYAKNIRLNELIVSDVDWDILIEVPKGCTDNGNIDPNDWALIYDPGNPENYPNISACNYDVNARIDDGSCEYDKDCFGECGGNAVYDICGICDGNTTELDNCTICADSQDPDCTGNCPSEEGCSEEFSFTFGCAIEDECGVCVGGNTERLPCEQDCTGQWGGNAYYDYCGEECVLEDVNVDCSEYCIGLELNNIDCLTSNIDVYNLDGELLERSILNGPDIIYAVLSMNNIPSNLEGIDLEIGYDPNKLTYITSSLIPSDLDTNLVLEGELENSYFIFSQEQDSTILVSIGLDSSNVIYQNNGGHILFLELEAIGNSNDSTEIFINKIQINERVMREENYSSATLYFNSLSNINNLYPDAFNLSQNYPNPFNPITNIVYNIPVYDFITIEIININGQIVKTIVESFHRPGYYEVLWDGKNNSGISLSTGIYFYKMVASNFSSTKKLVLLK